MITIKCPLCDKEFSENVVDCPNCEFPLHDKEARNILGGLVNNEGLKYLRGVGEDVNHEKALEIFLKSFELGSEEVKEILGEIYNNESAMYAKGELVVKC